MAYGSNSSAQIIAYGATNSDLDEASDEARKVASSTINSKLNISKDADSPSELVNDCCNTLAAAIISTSPEQTAESALWKLGMEMLNNLIGDSVSDANWRTNIPVNRFHSVPANSIVGHNKN